MRQRYEAVHERVDAGATIRQICRELGLSRGTVRRFARATAVDDLLPGRRTSGQVSVLAPFADHLHRRWTDGVTNAAALLREIRALGYTGGVTAVRDDVRPWRGDITPTRAAVALATTRHITGLLMRNPDDLDHDEQQQRRDTLQACCHLDRLAPSFAHGVSLRLPAWSGRGSEARRGEGAGSGVAERESFWQGVLNVIIETSKMVPDAPPIVVTVTRVPVYV